MFFILSLIWLMNSGHYTGLLLALGLASVSLVVWIAHRMGVIDQESQPLYLTAKLPVYWLWLLKSILLSNIDVVQRIWRGRTAIDPQVARLPVPQVSDLGKVVYANSINLTPGTLAIELKNHEVLVHTLTRQSLDELRRGNMARRSQALDS